MKMIEQAEAAGDEGSAENDGAEDSPEENARLAHRRDAKHAEEQKEDEQVVDGERLLQCIAGEELRSAGNFVIRNEDGGEGKRSDRPENGGVDRFTKGVGEGEMEQVLQRHQHEDGGVKPNPARERCQEIS